MNDTERRLTVIWREILVVDRIGIRDNFFDLGGDSSAAAELSTRLRKEFGKNVDVSCILAAPTIEQLARTLRESTIQRPRISTMQAGGENAPFFCVHACSLLRQLAAALGRPFLTLHPPTPEELPVPCKLEDIAAYHVRSMRAANPSGPYFIGGWCNEGIIAYEIARQLSEIGEPPAGVVMFDSWHPETRAQTWPSQWTRLRHHAQRLREIPVGEWTGYLAPYVNGVPTRIKRKAMMLAYKLRLLNDRRLPSFVREMPQIIARLVYVYRPKPYQGTVMLMRSSDRARSLHEVRALGWAPLVPKLQIVDVPGSHRTMFLTPNVEVLGSILCEMMNCEMQPSTEHDASFAASR